jgi:L-methionine (R)-S-oxide reductase
MQHKGADAVNWAGFYLVQRNAAARAASSEASALPHHRVAQRADQPLVLTLGPFQGQVACLRIPFGRGVCGAAASEQRTQLVPDVHAFPGHIACDSASASEIVVPIVDAGGVLRAIIDIDCPVKNGFSAVDQSGAFCGLGIEKTESAPL